MNYTAMNIQYFIVLNQNVILQFKSLTEFGSKRFSPVFKHQVGIYKDEDLFSSSVGWDSPGGPVAKILCSQCRGPGSIPGQGTRSHVPQLKILHATTKTWHSQINKF